MWRHEITLDLVKDKPEMVLVASFLQCLRKIISVLGCQAYEDLEWIPASSSAHKFVQMCLMLNHLGRCGWFLWMKQSDEVTKSAEVTNQRLPLTRQGLWGSIQGSGVFRFSWSDHSNRCQPPWSRAFCDSCNDLAVQWIHWRSRCWLGYPWRKQHWSWDTLVGWSGIIHETSPSTDLSHGIFPWHVI